MWAKVSMLLVICMLGLFLGSSPAFACHLVPEKSEVEQKSCCLDSQDVRDTDTLSSKEMHTEDCCNADKQDTETAKGHTDDCSKHCAEKLCRTSMHGNFIISSQSENLVLAAGTDQLSLYALYRQPFCSDAYFSIWQPPQIA